MLIRRAVPADAPAVAAIYAHYVRETAITFATEAPTAADYATRMADGRFPFLVAEESGCVLGFIYAAPFRQKEAYRWDVELTLYLRPECTGRGMGSRLMRTLLALLKAQGFLLAYSCITSSNAPSLALHHKLGFAALGEFLRTGFKHGQWHGVTWMQYALGTFSDAPQEPVPVSSLAADTVSRILEDDGRQASSAHL